MVEYLNRILRTEAVLTRSRLRIRAGIWVRRKIMLSHDTKRDISRAIRSLFCV